jgi:DNA-binding NtrC family response regulator
MMTHSFAAAPTMTTVLVVDDEPLVRWAVAETLADSGYDVLEAGDAKSALKYFPGPQADAVLLDVHLPDCNDLRVLTDIRRLSPKVPVILMTAFSTPELLDEARRLGAFAVVDKPFEVDELPGLIEQAVAPGASRTGSSGATHPSREVA